MAKQTTTENGVQFVHGFLLQQRFDVSLFGEHNNMEIDRTLAIDA